MPPMPPKGDEKMLILSLPAIYSLELTSACSNCCPGCSNVYAADRSPPPLPASTWERWLEALAPEAVRLRLTGGEPTLHPEFHRILQAATAYDAWVTVFSNARWEDPATFVQRLSGLPHLSGLLVSLHGATPHSHEAYTRVPGSFEETVANIRLAIDGGISVAISTIITHHNWDRLDAVAALGEELGVDHVAFNRYLGHRLPGIETTPEEMRAAVEQVEALIDAGAPVRYGIGLPQCFAPNRSEGCPAGATYAAIDPWGNVRPCAHSPTVVGSLHQASMETLWHGEAMRAWRALMPIECQACAAYTICHGGCRAIQELRPAQRDPLRGRPLDDYTFPQPTHELPAEGRPHTSARLRPESFGYVLLGQGQAAPLRAEARPVIEACNGHSTLSQLASRFGQPAIDLIGELWIRGLIEMI
ncbi:MAG TPA: radical SAM protein [Chloroflexi bacterium]|nr:radical SAM protein [Chloroflexota bacterium]